MGVVGFCCVAADAILTNDRRWAGKVDRPAVLVLEEWTA